MSRADEPAAERVLVLTPIGRDAEMVRELLVSAGMTCKVCADLQTLLAGISSGAGAAVIAQEALSPDGAEELRTVLTAQEPWSDIPVLLLLLSEESGSKKRPRAGYRFSVSVSVFFERTNVTLLQRPLGIQLLLSSVRSAVRARQRQYQMRDLHRELERALQLNRLSEAKFSGIVSISADAIISIDESQCITLFNDGAEKIFGYSKAEMIGTSIDVLIPERCRTAYRKAVQRFATGEGTGRSMGELGTAIFGLRKNGEEFPADAAISKLEVGGTRILTVTLRDVTEAKRQEGELRFLSEAGVILSSTLDYEETLTSVARLAVGGFADVCIVDVLDESGEMRRLRVASRDPSLEWACEILTRVPIDRRRPHLMWSALETRRPVLMERLSPDTIASFAQDEERLRSLRAIDPNSALLVPLTAHGEIVGVIAFLSSGRSRRYTSEDLRFAEALASRAALSIENARLYRTAQRATQARDDVLGIVAHDLRNPVTSIIMQADLLQRRGAEPEGHPQQLAEAIKRSALRVKRLIQDLLDLTCMEAGRLPIEQARVPASRVVSDSVEVQKLLASSASPDLRLDVARDVPEVWGDRDRLLQVLENLIGNAVKFTAPGGRIVVGAAPRDGEVLFWVTDTGAGIATGDLPHLFERFWQARKGERRGVGLGLPIVKGIVEAHRGRIWVESTPGQGSTFFFTIPTPQTEEWHREPATHGP